MKNLTQERYILSVLSHDELPHQNCYHCMNPCFLQFIIISDSNKKHKPVVYDKEQDALFDHPDNSL